MIAEAGWDLKFKWKKAHTTKAPTAKTTATGAEGDGAFLRIEKATRMKLGKRYMLLL